MIWPRRSDTALVNERLEDRIQTLEEYNRRLAELAKTLSEHLKEFSDDEQQH